MNKQHFLSYIKGTRSPSIYAACKSKIDASPDADCLAVLDEAVLNDPLHQQEVAFADALANRPITSTFRRRTRR